MASKKKNSDAEKEKNLLQRRGRDGPSPPPVAWTSTHHREEPPSRPPSSCASCPRLHNSAFATRTEMVEERGVNLPTGRTRDGRALWSRMPARPGSVFGGAARRGKEGRGRIGGKSKGSTSSSPPSPKLKFVAQKASGVSLRISTNERALQLLERGGVGSSGFAQWKSAQVQDSRGALSTPSCSSL